MPIPTELVGSLPRPIKLQNAYEASDKGTVTWEELQSAQDEAAADSIKRLEATGETFVTDGEQRESSFATYPITDTLAGTGLAENLAGDGQYFAIFDDGHHRQLPRLTKGPFRYKTSRVGVRGEEHSDRLQAAQAGGDLAVDDDATVPLGGRDPWLSAHAILRRCVTRRGERHPAMLRSRCCTRFYRFHGRPAREQERRS